ncbi:hypothetical protein GOB94_14425 [Granulicella sp. 5B5]|uniref:hypothetical protein n=1 Tax=Granulicella sp. 5B5 TaxID=1617967 RepID=UPI0015F457DB|nr:hypothetical protein [Granulicella sp. 5B5]QMV19757.1 hypothetical protein GOB94_14425 [Granulicella sp. 5B5]
MKLVNARYFMAMGWALLLVLTLPVAAAIGQTTQLPTGVERICSISFDKDTRRPARVENSALPCLKEGVAVLRQHPGLKLVLVGVKDPGKDHESAENGMMREVEDSTGLDVRLEDLSAYRAVNTKWYLVHYLGADPTRIIPTTDESYFAQAVTFYLVPESADYNHNFLGTTKTNERPCTITPCYTPDEESLDAQPRSLIQEDADGRPRAETRTDKQELAAEEHRFAQEDKAAPHDQVKLAPLPPRPTPQHPATHSIIPQ